MNRYRLTAVAVLALLAAAGFWWLLSEVPTPAVQPVAGASRDGENRSSRGADSTEPQEIRVVDSNGASRLREEHDRVNLRSEAPGNEEKNLTLKTYGALEDSVKDGLRSQLQSAVRSNMRKLENQDSMSGEQITSAEETILVRQAQIALLDRDEYITTDPGKGQKVWPHDTDDYVVLTSFRKSRGREVEITYLLEYEKFPELRSAREHLLDASYVANEVAAAAFNALLYSERRSAFAKRFSGRRETDESKAGRLLGKAIFGARVRLDKVRAEVHVLPRLPTGK